MPGTGVASNRPITLAKTNTGFLKACPTQLTDGYFLLYPILETDSIGKRIKDGCARHPIL